MDGDLMTVCRSCASLPRVQVTRAESHRLPRTWRPIDEHPELRPGPWVPRGEKMGVVYCEACGSIWYLFLDPGQYYYTDVILMAPELVAVLSEDATLEDVLAVAVAGDAMLQLMIRDWFALADYDAGAAARALVDEIAAPALPTHRAIRLLDFLAAVVAGAGRGRVVTIEDATPVIDLLEREDLVSLDGDSRASELNEIRRLVAGLARSGFGSAFGVVQDRIRTAEPARRRMLSVARAGRPLPRGPVLAPPGRVARPASLESVEQLVGEIEELVRAGATRVAPGEIAPVLDVVRSFWALGSADPHDPRWDPGLALYRRCRDLLFALRQADLVPDECECEVVAALAVHAA